MKLKEVIKELSESTYNLKELASLINFIVDKWQSLNIKKYNITEYFSKYLKNKDIKIFLSFVKKAPNFIRVYSDTSKKDNKYDIIYLEIQNEPLSRKAMERYIKHELIHILDFIRSYTNKKGISVSWGKDGNGFTRYVLDSYEFNRIVNEWKEHKRKNNIAWKDYYNSKTYSEMLQYFLIFDNYIFPGDKKVNKKELKNMLLDPSIKKRFLKRIVREKLLPKFIKGA